MLEDYLEHLQNNPDSLLAKIYGIFTVNSNNLNEVHIILMDNTLKLQNKSNLKRVFDLKGSMVDREVKVTSMTKSSTTLKDQNLLQIR
mmetsp:Transcript_22774/g.16120  ORF Transcript_22774/g.16120 Transcript_22774/m.16120 type:complete len:88 (+) Transcript_22774:993-1256(+)